MSPHGSSPRRITLRTVLGTAVSLVVLAAGAATAQAGPLVQSATSCEDQTFEQPFLPWADVANYVLAPNGTFEQGATRWTLSGGADVVGGNESYYVHGSGEASSLALPAGAVATSDSMCVGIEHPTLRLFARNTGAHLSTLTVNVLFEDAAGSVHALTIGRLTAGSGWQPSAVMPIVVNLLPLLPGERTAVAFRFSASAGGAWQVDDVYVDPYRSR
jgi:hypothetical protein